MWRFALLFVTCCLTSACTRWSYDIGQPLIPSQAVVGEASLEEVLKQLGPPHRISALPGGYVMGWEHWQVGETSLGVSLGPLGVDVLALDWGSARVAGEFLLLTFNRGHLLTDSSFSRWDENTGGGTALQPSLGLVDVVDVSDLVGAMPQHRWGASTLQTLPRTLNTASSPNAGDSGLEQRGSPLGAGQKTLELDD